MKEKDFPYMDILYEKKPELCNRRNMSIHDRAAQFAPFAALTGFEGAVNETARITEVKRELEEDEKQSLDEAIEFLIQNKDENLEAEFEYFVADERKDGGSYQKVIDQVKKIDQINHMIQLQSGLKIFFSDLAKIEIKKNSTSQM